MSAEIIPFCFDSQAVRVMVIDDEPWFVARDVCDILDLDNITNALLGLDEDELTSEFLMSGGQRREMKLISESGLYTLVIRSNKPQAKPFRRWVTREVLPSIRKTGGYEVTPCNRRETTINYQNLDKMKNPKRFDIRYTLDLTKMINKPTSQGLAILSLLTGLDFSSVDILPGRGEVVTLDDYFHRFIDERYEVDEQSRIGATELYETWQDWVRRNNLVECNVSMRRFGLVVGEYYGRVRFGDGVYYLGLRPMNKAHEEVA